MHSVFNFTWFDEVENWSSNHSSVNLQVCVFLFSPHHWIKLFFAKEAVIFFLLACYFCLPHLCQIEPTSSQEEGKCKIIQGQANMMKHLKFEQFRVAVTNANQEAISLFMSSWTEHSIWYFGEQEGHKNSRTGFITLRDLGLINEVKNLTKVFIQMTNTMAMGMW